MSVSWSGEGWLEAEWAAHPTVGLAGRFLRYGHGVRWNNGAEEKVNATGVALEARWYVVGQRDWRTGQRRPLCGLMLGLGVGGASAEWERGVDADGDGWVASGERRRGHEWASLLFGTVGLAIPLGPHMRLVPHFTAGTANGHDPWDGWFHIGVRVSVGF